MNRKVRKARPQRRASIPALALTLIATALPCAAQCAMCRASVANGENAAEMSHTINSAVLILFFPTLAMISGFVRLVLRYRHSKGGEQERITRTDE